MEAEADNHCNELKVSCRTKEGGIIPAKGFIMGKPTDTVDLSPQEPTEAGPRVRKPV